jgi:hypothetical protein
MNTSNSSKAKHPQQPKARSYRKDGYWFFQLAEDTVFGPFDKVYEAIMADRVFEERELDSREATHLLLQFA